jgi:hypothetical protein
MVDGSVNEGRIGESSETSVMIGESDIVFTEIKKAIVQIEFKAQGE